MVSEPEAAIQAAATDETSSRIAFKPDTLQRVAVTAAVLSISALLANVPAPGLSPDAIAHFGTATGDSATFADSRMSIVALGLGPILSALIAGEVLKLAAPSLYGLEDNPGRAHKFNRAVLILGLFFAAFQAYGVTVALEAVQLPGGLAMIEDPDSFSRLSYMVTLVAGVALTYWLAEIITRHGIGSGFWIMLLAGEVGAFPALVKQVAANHAIGRNSTAELLSLVIVIAAALFSIVALYRVRIVPADPRSPVSRLAPRDIMMPPLLGLAIASTLTMIATAWQFLTGSEATTAYSFDRVDPVYLIVCAAIILLISYLRAVTRPLSGAATAQAVRWSFIVGAITAAYTVALEIVSARAAITLIAGSWLTILIVVCLVFLSAQREQPVSEPANDATGA